MAEQGWKIAQRLCVFVTMHCDWYHNLYRDKLVSYVYRDVFGALMVSWAWAVQGLAHRRRTISSHLGSNISYTGSNISYNSADVRFAIGFLTFSIYKKCAIVFCIAAEFFSTSTAQKLSSSILHNLWIWIADQSSTCCCCWYRQKDPILT